VVARSSGSGSAAVMMWARAWISMVRYRRAVRTNFLMLHPVASSRWRLTGEGGEHDGQVRFDRLAPVVEGRPDAGGYFRGFPR
jgi:hypothetical protein